MDQSTSRVDLRARAFQALLDAGFVPVIPPEVEEEVGRRLRPSPSLARDLRQLLWSSIDNDESRDLDQIEFCEKLPDDQIHLLIAIADVDVFVPAASATDQHASVNTTSVYTGVATFPMLPEELSTDASSLLEGVDRLSVVVSMIIDASGEVRVEEVFRAWVHNHAKLTYNAVGAWLEGNGEPPAKIVQISELKAQVELQLETAKRLRSVRERNGALTLGAIEPRTIVRDGKVIDLQIARHNPARDIIEAFMVAANISIAKFLEGKGLFSLRRVVRLPRRWDRIREIASQHQVELPVEADRKALSKFLAVQKEKDPLHFPDLSLSIVKLLGPGEYVVEAPGDGQGHFGLAVDDYTHSTAPNRRYADLVTQRCIKSVIAGEGLPYTETSLGEIAVRCTERENAIRKIERLMRKVIAAEAMKTKVGQVFEAVVTGATDKGTYVRLLEWPAEGRVVRGEKGIDVGDKVRVRLLSTDSWRGFIDFERV